MVSAVIWCLVILSVVLALAAAMFGRAAGILLQESGRSWKDVMSLHPAPEPAPRQPPSPSGTRFRSSREGLFESIERYMKAEKPYLDPEFSRRALAEALYTNENYIYRAIKDRLGITVPQYVNSYKIAEFKRNFYEDMSQDVKELSWRSGFNSTSAFSVVFRSFEHMTPGEWMNMQRAAAASGASPPARSCD